MSENYEVAKEHLAELRDLLKEPSIIDEQFIDLYTTLLYHRSSPPEEKLSRFEHALLMTCPSYTTKKIPYLLSYEEIILLNNIAICCNACGNRDRAISILYSLRSYYEQHVISTEEALRTQLMILYNLSKYLGLSARYDECIEVCDFGIRLARETGRCQFMARTLFNRGWAHTQRNRAGDKEIAKINIRDSSYFASIMGNEKEYAFFSQFYQQAFSQPLHQDTSASSYIQAETFSNTPSSV